MKHISSKFALFSFFLSSYQTFGYIAARKPFLFGPMQPAESCSAPMRPVGQLEFETPALDLPVDGDGHAAVEDVIMPEARRPTAFHSNHF
jgi:hypothetical protein